MRGISLTSFSPENDTLVVVVAGGRSGFDASDVAALVVDDDDGGGGGGGGAFFFFFFLVSRNPRDQPPLCNRTELILFSILDSSSSISNLSNSSSLERSSP